MPHLHGADGRWRLAAPSYLASTSIRRTDKLKSFKLLHLTTPTHQAPSTTYNLPTSSLVLSAHDERTARTTFSIARVRAPLDDPRASRETMSQSSSGARSRPPLRDPVTHDVDFDLSRVLERSQLELACQLPQR